VSDGRYGRTRHDDGAAIGEHGRFSSDNISDGNRAFESVHALALDDLAPLLERAQHRRGVRLARLDHEEAGRPPRSKTSPEHVFVEAARLHEIGRVDRKVTNGRLRLAGIHGATLEERMKSSVRHVTADSRV